MPDGELKKEAAGGGISRSEAVRRAAMPLSLPSCVTRPDSIYVKNDKGETEAKLFRVEGELIVKIHRSTFRPKEISIRDIDNLFLQSQRRNN